MSSASACCTQVFVFCWCATLSCVQSAHCNSFVPSLTGNGAISSLRFLEESWVYFCALFQISKTPSCVGYAFRIGITGSQGGHQFSNWSYWFTVIKKFNSSFLAFSFLLTSRDDVLEVSVWIIVAWEFLGHFTDQYWLDDFSANLCLEQRHFSFFSVTDMTQSLMESEWDDPGCKMVTCLFYLSHPELERDWKKNPVKQDFVLHPQSHSVVLGTLDTQKPASNLQEASCSKTKVGIEAVKRENHCSHFHLSRHSEIHRQSRDCCCSF